MGKIQSHRDLVVWQKGMDLAVLVYDLAKTFPASERYGLVSQMTRAAVAVPANIAEGHARGTARDYAQFLAIAKGSLMETETCVTLAIRLGFVTESVAVPILVLFAELSKMLTTLRSRLLA